MWTPRLAFPNFRTRDLSLIPYYLIILRKKSKKRTNEYGLKRSGKWSSPEDLHGKKIATWTHVYFISE